MSTESLVNKSAVAAEDEEDFHQRWLLGGSLLIVADASFVVALSFSYLYLHGLDTEGAFHPGGSPTAQLWWSWVITACMLLGVVGYRMGYRSQLARGSGLVAGAGVGVLLMAVALVLNIAQIAAFPFKMSDNAYSSAVYLLAAANVFHLLLALGMGVGIVNRVRVGQIVGPQMSHVRIVQVWWIWIGAAAVIGAATVSVANGTIR